MSLIFIFVISNKMGDHNTLAERIITFGPRQVKFPSPNLGLLIDSSKEYQDGDFATLHKNLERDGYL